ncbi:hypothetical protein SCHIN_v1c10990 [Spiroplasma chinense]|uniref:Lipoprotein-associated type-17 domain-containing protein n=1 Tax=Spiroplasma chinense TaxID=216932 RepID=A0A5B9Y8E1_9MOLU|nr:hypothetical protein [Spiroplasma chinense]QEH62292.1 hypothetical protein SCHIN_v1c10990 [Spiroplasma chinense]
MKKLIAFLGGLSIVSPLAVNVVSCEVVSLTGKWKDFFIHIKSSYRRSKKLFVNEQEVEEAFKGFVEEYSFGKFKATLDKDKKGSKNLVYVNLNDLGIVNRYERQYRVEVFEWWNDKWGDMSVLGSQSTININYGVMKESIYLDKVALNTNSGDQSAIKVSNMSDLEQLEFSLDPFEDFKQQIDSDLVKVYVEDNEVKVITKHSNFEKTIYLRAKPINGEGFWGNEIKVSNSQNTGLEVILKDDSVQDFIYPENTEFLWSVENNDEVQGVEAIESSDKNLKAQFLNDGKDIKLIYQTDEKLTKPIYLIIRIVPKNYKFPIGIQTLIICPDDVALLDKDTNQEIIKPIEYKVLEGEENKWFNYRAKVLNSRPQLVIYKEFENDFSVAFIQGDWAIFAITEPKKGKTYSVKFQQRGTDKEGVKNYFKVLTFTVNVI